ncbi:heme transporter FLVCR2-like isoform X2 [Liolophura sinensis]
MENGGSVNLLPTNKTVGDKDLESPTEYRPRVYKRRWVMLAIFCAYSFSNAYQWIHLNIIADIMLRYYNQSLPSTQYEAEVAVDWLSMIYMLAYIPLILPATWLLDKKGLRVSSIIATLLNCLGAWLKCLSVTPDRFPVLMLAQTICAIAQLFVLGIPPRLAAVWFGLDEVSTATSIGVFGNQVGVAVGFLIPPEIVPNSEDLGKVGRDLRIMMYSTAGVTTALFILVLLFFKEQPPRPPSRAQQLAVQSLANTNYIQSLKNLLRHRGFIILVFAYGFNTGSFYAVSTLLNTLVLNYFPAQGQDAGRIGLTIVVAGVLGAIVAGIWLDKTRTYKATTLSIYIMSCAGMAAFTFTMDLDRIWVVYITAGTLGFFMTGYLPVGFEFAAEITYPEPEGTSSGLLNASAQFWGIVLTLGMRAMITKVDVLYANIAMTAALFIGVILTALIRSKYRRQEAEKEAQKVDIEIIDEEDS